MHILCVCSRIRETLLELGWKWTVIGPFFRTVYASDKLLVFVSFHVQLICCTYIFIYTFPHTFTKETKAIARSL